MSTEENAREEKEADRSQAQPAVGVAEVALHDVAPNGEAEGRPRSARLRAAGAQCLQRPRRRHTARSRSPPTIVRAKPPTTALIRGSPKNDLSRR